MSAMQQPHVAGGAPPGEIYVIPWSEEGAAADGAPDTDRYIVYAPLRHTAFIADAGLVNRLVDLREGSIGQEADREDPASTWLRQLGLLDDAPAPLPPAGPQGSPLPTSVTLFLTTGCSMRCTYCYASAGDTKLERMPIEVAQRGIDFVVRNATLLGAPGFALAFHGGGEPTLNWKVLTGAREHARRRADEHGLQLTASTATNGVLNEVQISWITTHLQSASVSFDGLPAVHDKHRPLANGKPSSERVLHTLARFDAARFRYGIRVTATADQIARLPESIDFICRESAPVNIQVEPAYPMGRWREAPSAQTEQFVSAFRVAREVARGYGRTLSYSAARVGLLTRHFCGVSQDSFSLSPKGQVSACYEVFSEQSEFADRFFYGEPTEGGQYRFDIERLQALRRLSVEHQPFCQGCFAKWHCAGDCHRNALSVDASGAFQGSDRCHITRALTRDQVVERIAGAGGLVWRGDGAGTGPGEGRPRDVEPTAPL
jgi:uncharacterized protein